MSLFGAVVALFDVNHVLSKAELAEFDVSLLMPLARPSLLESFLLLPELDLFLLHLKLLKLGLLLVELIHIYITLYYVFDLYV